MKIEDLEALEKTGTPVPWKKSLLVMTPLTRLWSESKKRIGDLQERRIVRAGNAPAGDCSCNPVLRCTRTRGQAEAEANAALIAASRNALPVMIKMARLCERAAAVGTVIEVDSLMSDALALMAELEAL